MNRDIFNIDLTRTLPPALKQDRTMQALSQIIARELQENARLICNNIIYARIDELPEKLLDILAYDLHIDWYNYDSSIEDKRELIKTSVKIHKKLGTVFAVETAIKALHEDCRIEEWFEYEGCPFCFRLLVDLNNNKLKVNIDEIISRVYMCKRLTAHFEAVILKKTYFQNLFLGIARTYFIKLSVRVKEYNKKMREINRMYIGIAKVERISICISTNKNRRK